MNTKLIISLGVLTIICTIVNISVTVFILTQVIRPQQTTEQNVLNIAEPESRIIPPLPSGYWRFRLEGPIISVHKEDPQKIIINAQLQFIDPSAQPQNVEIYLTHLREIVNPLGFLVELEDLSVGSYVTINTVEDPINLISDGQLTRNQFSATSIAETFPVER